MADVGCVSEVDLRALLVGDLPEPIAQAITRHIETCPSCEAVAQQLDHSTDPFLRVMRQAVRSTLGSAPAVESTNDESMTSKTAGRIDTKLQAPAGYTIEEEVGRGGMSVVYRAHQRRPERIVALKVLLDGGHASTERRLRLLAEANAIARLQHPNIVQVYEVGEHNGLPFLVLEFMGGGSLAQHLAHRPLPARQAAQLCEILARAVEHAHSQGVVHRDLKPANILLGADSKDLITQRSGFGFERSIVKISDFGLAKQERPDLTATGDVLGTPSYMAPEQAHGAGRQIGPGVDIYALGAMLYEFLTGRPPFLGASVLQTLEQVRSQEPVPPSKLRPDVPRDLETICLKCLQKEQDRRYPTALALAEDLRHFLAEEPIRARPVTSAERVWRWSKRRPLVAALTATLTLTLIGSMIALTALYLKADAQRRRAEEAEDSSRLAAATARAGEAKAQQSESQMKAVLEFFQEQVLSAAAPKGQHGGLGIESTIRSALDQAEATIARSFGAQPLVEASIRQVLGHTYFFAGERPKAIDQHQRAFSLRLTQLGPDHPETLKSMISLAQDYDAEGRRGEALKLYEQAHKLCEARLGPNDSETLWSMRGVAKCLLAEGRTAEALPLYEDALKRSKAALGPDHDDTLIYMSSLANAYRVAGRLAEAIPLFQETIKIERTKLRPDHPDTLITMNDLAVAYLTAGRFADGAALFRETSDVMKKALGPDHPQTLMTMNNLGVAYHEGGQFQEAISLLEDTVKRKTAKQGPENESTLITMGHLASTYADAGRLSEALILFEQTLKVQEDKFGADYAYRLYFLNQTGACLLKMKDFNRARTLLSDCLSMRMRKAPGDWWTSYTKCQLGQALTGLKRYPEAESLLQEAQKELIARQDKIPGRYHHCLREATQAIVNFYEACGKTDLARQWRQKLAALNARTVDETR
jgi:eukaryotic-like serine/threonine-protein kinase